MFWDVIWKPSWTTITLHCQVKHFLVCSFSVSERSSLCTVCHWLAHNPDSFCFCSQHRKPSLWMVDIRSQNTCSLTCWSVFYSTKFPDFLVFTVAYRQYIYSTKIISSQSSPWLIIDREPCTIGLPPPKVTQGPHCFQILSHSKALFGDDQNRDEELCQADPTHCHDLRQYCDQVWKLTVC